MNKVILVGRLTKDPDVRYQANDPSKAIARYTLAVDRRMKREGEATADFIGCVAFGKSAEFAEKYLKKGTKIAITGRIQTGSYTNRDGQKVYTTDVVVEDQEFVESKNAGGAGEGAVSGEGGFSGSFGNRGGQNGSGGKRGQAPVDEKGFMAIPEGFEDDLPFM